MEYKRENYVLAQHCISQALLQIKEEDDLSNKLSIQLWRLWSDIAYRMKNKRLEKDCWDQVCLRERNGNKALIHSKEVLNHQMKKMLGKAPWYRKLFL